jgi:hypothetical protein
LHTTLFVVDMVQFITLDEIVDFLLDLQTTSYVVAIRKMKEQQ